VPRTIDLNADVGEGMATDSQLLELVTSASIACGFHAGDTATMRALCQEAVERGISIGAHVGYRDREGFGRRSRNVAPETIGAEAAEQIAALQEIAAEEGGDVRYVKLHGALYERANTDADCAAAVVRALEQQGRPAVLAFPGSQLIEQAAAAGLSTAAEGFADRGYTEDGRLVPRSEPGAILDETDAVAQALRLAQDGSIRSLCVHGDTPGALDLARRIAQLLRGAGIERRAFA
jgi:5-oxoprolinase (ATP-hydrolysing) subunit A